MSNFSMSDPLPFLGFFVQCPVSNPLSNVQCPATRVAGEGRVLWYPDSKPQPAIIVCVWFVYLGAKIDTLVIVFMNRGNFC